MESNATWFLTFISAITTCKEFWGDMICDIARTRAWMSRSTDFVEHMRRPQSREGHALGTVRAIRSRFTLGCIVTANIGMMNHLWLWVVYRIAIGPVFKYLYLDTNSLWVQWNFLYETFGMDKNYTSAQGYIGTVERETSKIPLPN